LAPNCGFILKISHLRRFSFGGGFGSGRSAPIWTQFFAQIDGFFSLLAGLAKGGDDLVAEIAGNGVGFAE
jgi:hypothetical protein